MIEIEKSEKSNVYLIPLIGGILCIISFFTPVMWTFIYGENYRYWFWGLRNMDGLSFNTERIDILISGIIIGLLICVSGIKMVFSANSVRIGKFSFEDKKKTWITAPSLVILAGITWFIYISNFGDDYFLSPGYDVWDYFFIDFGLIGAFSGSALTIIGYIFHRIIRDTNIMNSFVTNFQTKPKKEIIVHDKKYPFTETKKGLLAENPNFCPMCGLKKVDDYKFCPNCGFRF